MTGPGLHLVVPGPLTQRTGGYLYDARMVDGLRARGWQIEVHGVEGRFPVADDRARASLATTLATVPAGGRVVIDGLALAAAAEAAPRHRRRLDLVALVHHPLSDETGLDRPTRARLAALETSALRLCRGVVVTSAFTARRLGRFGVDGGRVRVVRPGTAAAARAVGPPPGAPAQLLVVGSVIPRKGHDVLVRALGRLRHRRWRCVCAGSLGHDAPYADGVVASVAAAGLAGRIDFAGECDDPRLDRLYAGASLFVLPSHYEGYGMVLTEALARGLPIVSTTGGAIPDTVPADAGRLVPPGDAAALADAIDALVGEATAASTRSRYAAAARRHAATLPRWDTAAAEMEAALVALAPPRVVAQEAMSSPAVMRETMSSPDPVRETMSSPDPVRETMSSR